MSKKTKVILLCVAVAVCVVAAVVCFILFGSGSKVLYFNVDGYTYQSPKNTAISDRQPGADGVYEIDFVVDGKTVTYTTKDAELVNRVDSMQVMTMKVSGDGVIQSVAYPGKPLAKEETIQQIKDGELVVNSSIAYTGKETTLKLAKDCRFYDLSNSGADTQPEIMDEVLVYGNARGEATDIFIVRRVPHTKLYWRLNRKYDSKTMQTTRKPDDNGVFTIPFSVEGERVELKCKDWAVMSAIEEPISTNAAMGLVLDEEGFITEMLPAWRTLRGRELCNTFHVMSVDGNRVKVANKQMNALHGISQQVILDEDCQIFDVSSGAEQIGQKTDHLQEGDLITVYSDPLGIATHIFVQVRILEGPLYYNLMRMYVGGHTGRQPDAQGWYSFDMLCDGKQVALKTQDAAIADKVDSYSSQGMGLQVNGDVIERVYDSACVTGVGLMVSKRYVESNTTAMIVAGNSKFAGLKPTMLHPDCKIYDVTGESGIPYGTETSLQRGDCIVAFGNADNQATHVFIISRKK